MDNLTYLTVTTQVLLFFFQKKMESCSTSARTLDEWESMEELEEQLKLKDKQVELLEEMIKKNEELLKLKNESIEYLRETIKATEECLKLKDKIIESLRKTIEENKQEHREKIKTLNRIIRRLKRIRFIRREQNNDNIEP